MPSETDILTQELEESDEESLFEEAKALIASLDALKIQDLALASRRGSSPNLPSSIYCTVKTPPRSGGYNLVYEVSFSDGLTWAVRVPYDDDVFSPSAMRSMHLDIVAQRYISSHTSLPLPRIHGYCLDGNNIIQRPYLVMDFLPGTALSKLWNDKAWISPSKRQYIFDQLAGWMTELSDLEFDQIGRVDVDSDGSPTIVPFPDIEDLLVRFKGPAIESHPTGPFHSASTFLDTLLRSRTQTDHDPVLHRLRLFLSALPDLSLDSPPFTLAFPDFDTQNVLVAADGTITGLIDWDGVHTTPRQGGAAAYPAWLRVDWIPTHHNWSEDGEASERDTLDELHEYRKMYLDAIDRASAGRLTSITRNSHVWASLFAGLTDGVVTLGVVNQLSQYVFGSSAWGYQTQLRIARGPWYGSGQDPHSEIARVDQSKSSSQSIQEFRSQFRYRGSVRAYYLSWRI